jgi:hypothetical protein
MVREGARSGFVFCARVGDHPEPQFRFVPLDRGAEVVGDTLSCLAAASSTADSPRVLDAAMHEAAYDAWARARGDIYTRSTEVAVKEDRQPSCPGKRAVRDSAGSS